MPANVIIQNPGLGALPMMAAVAPALDTIFGAGKASASTFQSTAAGILGADESARSSRLQTGLLVGLGGVAAVGLVAYLVLRK
jgi:hypothetical protein